MVKIVLNIPVLGLKPEYVCIETNVVIKWIYPVIQILVDDIVFILTKFVSSYR